ncbi:putative ferric-chelate reductase 1-like [Penaeus vannamei]|uniref:Putative ferric-chelate reductase 1-like n=1 Tax=Penaeus vannamei TaxID=6689 RepID=A0A423U4I6_PENVA|nr:putative ferric-chelate reductase 1-like [Penaeus vannamei]
MVVLTLQKSNGGPCDYSTPPLIKLHFTPVTISGPPFKGFFVQAQDSHTGDWLGEFLDEGPVKTHPECSAITHADKARKKHIRLTWRAPRSGSGSVTFTGTVLERYDKYWSDMVAQVVPSRRHF